MFLGAQKLNNYYNPAKHFEGLPLKLLCIVCIKVIYTHLFTSKIQHQRIIFTI